MWHKKSSFVSVLISSPPIVLFVVIIKSWNAYCLYFYFCFKFLFNVILIPMSIWLLFFQLMKTFSWSCLESWESSGCWLSPCYSRDNLLRRTGCPVLVRSAVPEYQWRNSVSSSLDNYSQLFVLFGQQKLYVTMEMHYSEKKVSLNKNQIWKD